MTATGQQVTPKETAPLVTAARSGDEFAFTRLVNRVEAEQERQGVLTVAVDNQERTITEARGRYNAVPHGSNRSAKTQRIGKGYLQLLEASAQVPRQWQDRERLRRTG